MFGKNFAITRFVGMAYMVLPAFSQSETPATIDSPQPESKRILGIIPNYRTSPSLQNYKPLTTGEKFKLASEDAFDRGTVGLAALFGGEAQLTNANRTFGQGAAGFARYFGAAYGDLVVGDYITEAVVPALLHQDPRYFLRGTGSGWSRLGYAMGADLLDPSRFGRDTVQLFRSNRKLNRDSTFDLLLCGQPDCCRWRI